MASAFERGVTIRRVAVLLSGVLSACALSACASSAEDQATNASDLTSGDTISLAGGDIVRGVVGLSPVETSHAAKTRYAKAADELVAQIDLRFPGRLTQLQTDLVSRDPAKVRSAKALLDETLLETKEDPEAAERVKRGAIGLSSTSFGGLHPLSAPLDGFGEVTECAPPSPIALTLGQVDGRYGDDRSGAQGALADAADLVDPTDILVWRTLKRIDTGELVPDPESRLGAYAATRGYSPGTVGEAVHNAIGTIYLTFANYGQEKIGRLFNAPEAIALYRDPVTSCSGLRMATIEHQYWANVVAEDAWSPGGNMGAMFNPTVRDLLQTFVFSSDP